MCDSKLGSWRRSDAQDEECEYEPQAVAGRPAEPRRAQGADAGGPGEAPAAGPGPPAVAVLHRPRTTGGKAKVAANGTKSHRGPPGVREIRAALAGVRALLDQ